MKTEPYILLVDDDDLDVMALKRAFKRVEVSAEALRVARDGLEALELLQGVSEQPSSALPSLILMDINMPRMSGLECLEAIRADPRLQGLVVFMMTTSTDVLDRQAACRLNAAGYVVKSQQREQFDQIAQMVQSYMRVVLPPTSPRFVNYGGA